MKMILLSVVMLLCAFEPAFSGKIMKKLDKELKKIGLQRLKKSLAEIGTNTVDIGDVKNVISDSLVKGDSYQDVNLLNNYGQEISGVVKYSGAGWFCNNDAYDIMPGKKFINTRGFCLITHITGLIESGPDKFDYCQEFKSPGSKHHQFVIEKNCQWQGVYYRP